MSKVTKFHNFNLKKYPWLFKSKEWLLHNYAWPVVLFLTIIAGYLRLYKLEDTLIFLGDQGRDALIVAQIFQELDPVFIGPVTSVGNMYLGPFYYYFMLPWLWLSYPSPMGPVYAVAILGTLLIPLSYFLIRRVLPQFVALTTSFLLAFNVIAIQLSRFSWNPNIAPFFSLIWLYCLWMTQIGKLKYWFLVALSVAILAQLHYVTLIVLVPSLFVWMQQLFKYRKEKTQLKSFIFVTLISAFILILSTLPLILFDLKNGGINARAFASIIHGDDAFAVDKEKTERVVQIIGQTRARSAHVMTELFFGKQQSIGVLLAFTVLVALALSIYNERNKKIYSAISVALITVLVSIIALSIYKNDVYNHYIAFLIPVICLLYAYLLYKIWLMGRSNKIVVLAFLLFYFVGSLGQISFQSNGPSMNQLRKTANAIHELIAPNEIYALLLLSQTKDTYGMNYRYYASLIRDKKPIGPEFLDQASSMIVIQEDRELDNPLSLPLYELLVFNVATPSAQIEIENGPIIYKLEKIRSETNQN